ncbi:hypothetical protein Scep_016309 [Stephania cephalantha]|uniref:HMA domain-containing protein n=1 Tax=Stephania cephalantha TaxID=152367 RepID=A0AAP0IP52_9MAGN
MGFLDHFSGLVSVKKRRKSKPMQTVVIKVKMDCDGCERRVRHAACSVKGAKTVEVSRKESRVSVTGYVDANKVLKKIRSTGKKADMWPYVAYNLVSYPYAYQAYDKKAPAGYVKDVPQAMPSPRDLVNEKLVTLFSDENAHACSIM